MKYLLKIILTLFIFINLFADEKFEINKIETNLGIIWGIDFIDDERMILTTKAGNILVLELDTLKLKPLIGKIDVHNHGQGGLLDVKKSPNFDTDKTFYFTYSKSINNQGVTTLASAKFDGEKLINFKDLFVSNSATDKNVHFGSRITFDENGHLFFSIGDRGIRGNAQDLTNHAGTIIRLNLDGSIPSDNPFVKSRGKLPEIYSYGHRNPQGIFYDKKTQRLWSIEHGPRGGDEINLIEKGKNYGWPVISYGKEYWAPLDVGEGTHKKGMIQPKKVYIPSIAPSSLIVYNGKLFKSLDGKILATALKLRHLNKVEISEDLSLVKEERFLENIRERMRNVVESKNGELFISTDSGNIYKISSN
ncbi:PQQ-dependent sugar dehydrogenase [Arcobacter arenosus]|uniref:PQQ-dependent sugar dehydrogenase n=1 Tax=Arcobacter arenosus TaxID=2576037 RepID=UPI003BAC5692